MDNGVCGGGVGGDEMYKENAEPVLDLLSDSYFDDDRILIGSSKSFSCTAYTVYWLL